MGDITHFFDDVTRFSFIYKPDRDRYMEPCPKTGGRWCEVGNIHPLLNAKGWKTVINLTQAVDFLYT